MPCMQRDSRPTKARSKIVKILMLITELSCDELMQSAHKLGEIQLKITMCGPSNVIASRAVRGAQNKNTAITCA